MPARLPSKDKPLGWWWTLYGGIGLKWFREGPHEPRVSRHRSLCLILRPLHVRNCSDGRCFYTVFDLPALIQQESDSTTERQGPLLSRAYNLPKTITTKGFRVSLPIIPTPVSGLTPLNGCASHSLCYVHIQTRFVGLISVDVPLLSVNLFNIARE
jgi:hypothetical protein